MTKQAYLPIIITRLVFIGLFLSIFQKEYQISVGLIHFLLWSAQFLWCSNTLRLFATIEQAIILVFVLSALDDDDFVGVQVRVVRHRFAISVVARGTLYNTLYFTQNSQKTFFLFIKQCNKIISKYKFPIAFSIAELYERFFKLKCYKKNTVNGYITSRQYLTRYFGFDTLVASISQDDVKKLHHQLSLHISDCTLSCVFWRWKVAFTALAKNIVLKAIPKNHYLSDYKHTGFYL